MHFQPFQEDRQNPVFACVWLLLCSHALDDFEILWILELNIFEVVSLGQENLVLLEAHIHAIVNADAQPSQTKSHTFCVGLQT